MEHKRGFEYTFGILLILVSLFMIFKNTYITTIHFYRFGGVNTGAILIVLLLLAVIFAVVKPSPISKILIGVIVMALVLALILGTHIRFKPMSVLDLILMLLPLAIGIGLVLKNLLTKE